MLKFTFRPHVNSCKIVSKMKKTTLIAALVLPLSMTTIFAQNTASKTEVSAQTVVKESKRGTPIAVKAAFKQRFPTVTKVSFDKEGNGEFEAGFKMDGVKMSANFTADGTWRETESEIGAAALPATVTQ